MSSVSTLCMWCSFNDRVFNFTVIGPQQNHYSRKAAVAWFALVLLHTALYNLHISFHTVNTVFPPPPVLVCGGTNAVICCNGSSSGTVAMGRVGKWFPHKLFLRVFLHLLLESHHSLCVQTLCWLWFARFSVSDEFVLTVAVFNSW